MKQCPYCETKVDGRYRAEIFEGHIKNCLKRHWCQRCGYHRSLHTGERHSQQSLVTICERFVGKRPNLKFFVAMREHAA